MVVRNISSSASGHSVNSGVLPARSMRNCSRSLTIQLCNWITRRLRGRLVSLKAQPRQLLVKVRDTLTVPLPKEGRPAFFTSALPDYHLLRPNVSAIPLRLRQHPFLLIHWFFLFCRFRAVFILHLAPANKNQRNGESKGADARRVAGRKWQRDECQGGSGLDWHEIGAVRNAGPPYG